MSITVEHFTPAPARTRRVSAADRQLSSQPGRVAAEPGSPGRSATGARRVVRRVPADAGPRRALAYGPARARRSAVPHAAPAAQPQPRAQVVVAAALLAAVVVMGLLGLAHLRAGDGVAVPEATTVVQVNAGESLSDVAARVAPEAPVGAVVERIRELNGLSSSALHPGQMLVTPTGTGN